MENEKEYSKSEIGLTKDLSKLIGYEFSNYVINAHGIVYKEKNKDNIKYYSKSKPFITKRGYVEYVLTDNNGIKKHLQAQRIMGLLWLTNKHNLPHVNHKDGNKENNHYKNLEWMTISDNNKHKYRVLGHVPHNKIIK